MNKTLQEQGRRRQTVVSTDICFKHWKSRAILNMKNQGMQQVLVLCLMVACVLTQTDSDCTSCVTLGIHMDSNHTVINKTLVGYSLSSFLVSAVDECFTACIEMDCRCTSFNLNVNPDGRSAVNCTLNYHTKHSRPESLQGKAGHVYYDITTSDNKV